MRRRSQQLLVQVRPDVSAKRSLRPTRRLQRDLQRNLPRGLRMSPYGDGIFLFLSANLPTECVVWTARRVRWEVCRRLRAGRALRSSDVCVRLRPVVSRRGRVRVTGWLRRAVPRELSRWRELQSSAQLRWDALGVCERRRLPVRLALRGRTPHPKLRGRHDRVRVQRVLHGCASVHQRSVRGCAILACELLGIVEA